MIKTIDILMIVMIMVITKIMKFGLRQKFCAPVFREEAGWIAPCEAKKKQLGSGSACHGHRVAAATAEVIH